MENQSIRWMSLDSYINKHPGHSSVSLIWAPIQDMIEPVRNSLYSFRNYSLNEDNFFAYLCLEIASKTEIQFGPSIKKNAHLLGTIEWQ